jgi:hypothetical protein
LVRFLQPGVYELDDVDHLPCRPVVEFAGGEAVEDKVERVVDGFAVCELRQGLACKRPWTPGEGAAELAVVIAEDAGGEGGGLALNATGRTGRCGPSFYLYFYCSCLTVTTMPTIFVGEVVLFVGV